MQVRGRGCCKMPCESCAVQFSVFKRKRACSECERYYCSGCLRRGGGTMCAACRVLTTRPLARQTIAHLKVRDLQCFLQRQNVSTRGCVEKEELVSLCVLHVNSAAYRRRGSRAAGPFTALKGLTTNLNEFLSSAFDLRNPPPQPQPPGTAFRSSCRNAAHAHSPGNGVPHDIPDRRFTPTPGGERDIRVPVPEAGGEGEAGTSEREEEGARVDTTDCFEIEDLADTGWEFVTRPADPLPNDSEVLLLAAERSSRGAATPQRAASELELHRSESVLTAASQDSIGTVSLHEEIMPTDLADSSEDSPQEPINLEQFKKVSDLDLLSGKQLKELLSRNRVEYRGCLERRDLLERAKMLWRDHAKYKDQIDSLPIEDSCKICMAAPLECVLLECGHIAACTACSKQLAECPICRQYVVRAVRFFRS
ncbi:E3 ubiquitin-protein ligase rififylin [Maniola jurtina]|uniref:E3 ubiquitin-protein ligase rififylin n=1 Tax=Maniola jurtina TaxID=191418 RepID=UPI001E689539|nr:E3 ubiquitin-protein ligase rififylin [Maniola jurtina]